MIREFYHHGIIFLGREVVVENESRYKADNQPTPVFLPVEFHGLQSLGLQRVEHDWKQLSTHAQAENGAADSKLMKSLGLAN